VLRITKKAIPQRSGIADITAYQQPKPHSWLRICQIEQQLDPQSVLQLKKNILLTSYPYLPREDK
jgi:hypothetical protein